MHSNTHRRFGSAHVLALLALFVALGGGAYAVTALPRHSVGTQQLRARAVTLSKISARARTALKGAAGAKGPVGLKGDTGVKGDTGPVGPSDTYVGGRAAVDLTASYTDVASVTVPAGDYVLHADAQINGGGANAAADGSCVLASGVDLANIYDSGSLTLPPLAGAFSAGIVSLDGALSAAAQQSVVLVCEASNGTTVHAYDTRVIATRVGQVHGLPLPMD